MKSQNNFSGIRIYNGVTSNVNPSGTPIFVHGRVEKINSDFYTFFNSLLKEDHSIWAFQNSPDFWSFPEYCFDLDDEDENSFEKLSDKLFNTGYIYRNPEDGKNTNGYYYEGKLHQEYTYTGIFNNDFMKSYSKYIKDDWNQIIAIDNNFYNSGLNDDIVRFFNFDIKLTLQEEITFLQKIARWYFYNFDGHFWAFYSKDINDICKIKDDLIKYPKIVIEDDDELKLNELKLEFMSYPKSIKDDEKVIEITKEFDKLINDLGNELKKDENKDDIEKPN